MSKFTDDAAYVWKHAGLVCALRETKVGFGGPYNGYVYVPPGHPAAWLDYDDDALSDIDVHYGPHVRAR